VTEDRDVLLHYYHYYDYNYDYDYDYYYYYYYYYYIHLMAFFQDNLGKPASEKGKAFWILLQ